MKREVFALLAIASLIVGASLPFIVSNIYGESYKPITPTYQLSSPYSGQQVNTSLISLEGLKKFSSYEELSQFLRSVTNLRTLVNQPTYYGPQGFSLVTVITPVATIPLASGLKESSQTTATSKTNVQVEGIDEPDIVKVSDGIIAVASGSKVFIVSVPGKTVSSVLVLDEYVRGLFLYKNRLVVITETYVKHPIVPETECRCFVVPSGIPNVNIYVFDVNNASNPSLINKITVTGGMLSSRLSGNYLYVVTNTPASESIIPLVNEKPVPLETLVVVDVIPEAYTMILALDLDELNYTTYTFMTGSGSWLYMSLNNLYIARGAGFSYLDAYVLTLRTFTNYLPGDVANKISGLIDAGQLDAAREKIEDYLLNMSEESRKELITKVVNEVNKEPKHDLTTFYVFSVEGLTISLRGSFNVSGHLLDQFAMEETGNYFITATTDNNYSIAVSFVPAPYQIYETTTKRSNEVVIQECSADACVTRSFPVVGGWDQAPYWYTRPRLIIYVSFTGEVSNNVFITNLTDLSVVGSLRGLARGERIYSARLVGNVFFLVTFRQVDPLFAIDVSDPEKPRVLGFLKIPGFSEYLHPLPGNKLLGIGLEDRSLKISLFNVTDPTNMSEIAKVLVYSAWSQALQDHHAVTIYPEKELVMIPITSYSASYVSSGALVVRYGNNELKVEAILPHEYCIRIAYVGNELYTISSNLIKIFNANTYEELGQIILEK